VDEVQDIHNRAAAMKAYARQANDRQLEIDASEIRIRAERRLGEMIKAQGASKEGLNPGGRPPKTGSKLDPVSAAPPLATVGIDKHLADRARKTASIPEDEFENVLAEHREEQKAVRGVGGTGANGLPTGKGVTPPLAAVGMQSIPRLSGGWGR